MEHTQFVNRNDMDEFLPLAASMSSERLSYFCRQAEKVKCTEFLGRELYEDIQQNPDTPEYIQLMVYIRPMLVYWAYVYFIEQGQMFSTATGVAIKRSDASIPLSEQERAGLVKSYCHIARLYESELNDFLKKNADDYPKWKHSRQHTGCQTFSISKTETSREI